MGRSLDTDLRRRAVAAVEGGLSTGEAAERFSVSKAAVGAWVRLKRATGDVLPKPQGSGFGSMLDPHEGFILGLIAADRDVTLAEIADRLEAECGLSTPERFCSGWPEQKCSTDASKKASDIGGLFAWSSLFPDVGIRRRRGVF